MSPRATLNGRPGAAAAEVHAGPAKNGAGAGCWHGRELVLGRLAGAAADGTPLVDFTVQGETWSCHAIATISVSHADVGRTVVLAFVAGDLTRPILLGLVNEAGSPVTPAARPEERVEVTANRELVLRCGRASVTLTRAGKILIRGAYLLSRSAGVNRIKGASVQIN